MRGPLATSRNSRSAASAVGEAVHHAYACRAGDGCSHEAIHDLRSVDVWDGESLQLQAPGIQDDAWDFEAMHGTHELEHHKKFDRGYVDDDVEDPQQRSAVSMSTAHLS